MDDITVLVTGTGAPGTKGTLFSLKNNFDKRKVRVIGTDIQNEVIGHYLCDNFYQISKPSDGDYLNQLIDICEENDVSVILPQNTAELSILAQNRHHFHKTGANIAVSSEQAIDIANDKSKITDFARKKGIPTPEYYLVDTFENLVQYAEKLGWPENPVVIKPPKSNGMRGVRIIDESLDLKKMYYEEKPSSLYINMRFLKQILGIDFPPIMVMEYLPYEEYTLDILKAKEYIIVPRLRNLIKSGITFQGTVTQNAELEYYALKLSESIGLEYAFGFQFKHDINGIPKLLEANPRIQGTMVLSTMAGANIIYGAVKQALHEEVPGFNIKWGTKLIRYWGGIGVFNTKMTTIL